MKCHSSYKTADCISVLFKTRLWFSVFVKRNLFCTTYINKDNIYCDVKNKICNFLNKFRHETLVPHPSIILIAFFCIVKIMELCDKFPQNIIPQLKTEWKKHNKSLLMTRHTCMSWHF
jgi:hypothetical protein